MEDVEKDTFRLSKRERGLLAILNTLNSEAKIEDKQSELKGLFFTKTFFVIPLKIFLSHNFQFYFSRAPGTCTKIREAN